MSHSNNLKILAGVGSLVLLLAVYFSVAAEDPANQHFFGVWQRTDQPVRDGQVTRTWMWGPEAFTPSVMEQYADSPGGQREVQYYDKSRMEITNPNGDSNSIWFVTNGLLVNELMTGQLQLGDNSFQQHGPAEVNVAGDADDVLGPTYAAMANLRNAPALPSGSTITQTVDRNGNVGNDASFGQYSVTAAERVQVPGIDHQVASVFWDFMTSTGLVIEGGQLVTADLFQNPYFATGFPVTEAYWSNIKVAGSVKAVLIQCFERRCLTYTPSNAVQWRVEQGNVGQHYYRWRYEQIVATPTATATTPAETATEPGVNPTATGTSPASTGTPPATVTGTLPPTVTATMPAPTATATAVQPSVYNFASSFGGRADLNVGFVDPWDVDFDPDGNFYVTDRALNKVMKFNRDGVFLTSWGTSGSGAGQMAQPHGIEVVVTGSGTWVYVADTGNNRIQIFESDGMFVGQWGSLGSADGQFDFPQDIAADSLGNLYVVDAFNNRIQKFNAIGSYSGKWDGTGGVGPLSGPSAVAVGPGDDIYVLDTLNDRVQVFDSNGGYLRNWGSSGGNDGQFSLPTGIAIDTLTGRVFVSGVLNNRVQVFDTQGQFLTKFGGLLGEGSGELAGPVSVGFDRNGALYVVDALNLRLQIFSTADFSAVGQIRGDTRERFELPTDLTLTPSGNIVVADEALHQVKIFTPAGSHVNEFGESGTVVPPTAPLINPYGVATDSLGNIYVTDINRHQVVKFDALGNYLLEWGSMGNGNGQLSTPTGIAVDSGGNVYVADGGNHRIQKFTNTGSFIRSWGAEGAGDGELFQPGGVAVHGSSVFVADQGNNRVQEFDLDGNFVRKWGSLGTGNDQFDRPVFVAVDAFGYVYVSDSENDRIQKFTPTGEYFATIGSPGGGNGQLDGPLGVATDSSGNVIVAEQNNWRVQIFSPGP